METFKTSLKKWRCNREVVTQNWCIGQKIDEKNGFKNKVTGQGSQYAFGGGNKISGSDMLKMT